MSEQTTLAKRCEAAIDVAVQRGQIPRASAAAWRKGAQAGSDVRPALQVMPANAAVAAANAQGAAEDPGMARIMASFAVPQSPAAAFSAGGGKAQRQVPSATVAADEARAAELAHGLCFSRQMPPAGNGATLGIGSELAPAEVGS